MSKWETPGMGLLVKIGSALVHAEEFLSPGGHDFDLTALRSLLSDQEVRAWLEDGEAAALLPKRREPDHA